MQFLTLMGEGLLCPWPGSRPRQLLTSRVVGKEDIKCVGAVQMKQVSQLPHTQVSPAVERDLVQHKQPATKGARGRAEGVREAVRMV